MRGISVIRRGISLPIRLTRRLKGRAELARLISSGSPKLRAIGEALRESLRGTTLPGEEEWFSRIELRRSMLLASDREISMVDYGAGSPDANRTMEEMKKGVHSKVLVTDVCKASKPPFWGAFLSRMVRRLEPSSCVEMGSCVGISGAYLASALGLNGEGNLVTLEGSPEIAEIAEETLKELDLSNTTVVTGPFHETLLPVLEAAKPVDFFFNDGHHDRDAVLKYFDESLPYLADEAVMVFDDISWSSGMREAWKRIEDDRRVSASIDLQTIGIALPGSGGSGKGKFRIPL